MGCDVNVVGDSVVVVVAAVVGGGGGLVDRVVGELNAHNIGPSSVQFFGENDATSAPFSGTPSQQRIGRSLLPIGRSRSFQVVALPAFPIDIVTMTVTLTYPDKTESATKQVVISRSMLVINPLVLVVICVLIALVVGWRLRARQRRRSIRRAAVMSPARLAKARRGAR